MNANNILILGVTLLVAIIGALVLGESVASENYALVAGIMGTILLIGVIATLKSNIWILIPIFFAFGGRILLLPLPFSVSNIVVMFTFSVLLGQLALGFVKPKFGMTKTDVYGFLCMASVALTFMLNPVGIAAMGSDTVGSRPYFEVALGICAYVCLSVVTPNLSVLRKLPMMQICLSLIMSMGSTLAYFVSSIGTRLYLVYTGFAPHLATSSDPSKIEVARLSFLVPPAMRWMLYSMARPSAWRVSAFGLGITLMAIVIHLGAALMSGHRLAVINWVAHIGLFILITRNFKLGFIAVFFGLMAIGGLYTYHHAIDDIPLSAQRALTTLPGEWDHEVIRQTSESTEWRIEMWKQAMFEEGMIDNKLVGDGFGYSSDELQLVSQMTSDTGALNSLSPEDLARYFLVTGDLHSGPVSTIKHVGYVGLLFVLMFAISMAYSYYRLCMRTRGTPLWPTFVYFGIPSIWFPISYIFLYGDFKTEFPLLLVAAGLLKLLHKAEQLQRMGFAEERTIMSTPTDTEVMQSRV